jgi:Domain of unknown function (DUF2017)
VSGFFRDGKFVVVHLTDAEAGVLRHVLGEVLTLLDAQEPAADDDPMAALAAEVEEATGGLDTDPQRPEDPVLARLLPDGYRDDPDAAGELRRLTETSLRAGKVAHARAVLDLLPTDGGRVRLSGDAAESWLGALNDARLALGTRLEVADDTDYEAEIDRAVATDPNSSRAAALIVFHFLGVLQESLLGALSDD